MKNKQNLLCLMAIAISTILIAGLSSGRSLSVTAPRSIPVAVSPASKAAQKVSLAGGRVSFVPPTGFTAMTPQEIALKFPKGNPPQHVYANERRSVAVAVTFSQARVAPEQLTEVKNVLPKMLSQAMPDIQWITQDFTTINHRRWIRMEFVSQAIDTKIHNDSYFTSFDGKLLGFNFNSTIKQYEQMKAELRKSRDSITVR